MNSIANLPLADLSLTDKLLLMERLWEDLCRKPADIPSPDWHGEILERREADLREGRTSFIDWEVAKKRLRERLQ